MFGWTELLIILLVVLLVFGASRLPEIAKSLGMSVNEFKRGLEDGEQEELEDSSEAGSGEDERSSTGEESSREG